VAARWARAEVERQVSWAWAGALCVAGLGAGVSAALANALKRETAQLRLARAEVNDLKGQLRGAGNSRSVTRL
jgi:hypothetical protein